MNARALIPMLVTGTLFAVGALAGKLAVPAHPATPAPVAAHRANGNPSRAVTLAEIVVRPSAAELAAALAEPDPAADSPFVAPTDTTASSAPAPVMAPRANFDMPYYSFRKALPRVSRE